MDKKILLSTLWIFLVVNFIFHRYRLGGVEMENFKTCFGVNEISKDSK